MLSSAVGERSMKEEILLARLDPRYAWQVTKELVELGPHKIAGTSAERVAAQWISDEMIRLGLRDVRLEPFAVVVRDLSQPGSVRITGGPSFDAWAMAGSWATPGEGITGELVYVGRGTCDEYGPDVDVSGKIVLFERAWPDMFGEDGIFRSTPVLEAWHRGAKAIMTFDTLGPSDAARIQILLLGKDHYRLRIPCVVLPSRDARVLIDRLRAGPIEVTVTSPIQDAQPGHSYNVVGCIPGHTFPEELVIVASHYDTWWHGAVDSLSGIGAILGIAKAMLEAGIQPERTLVFIAHGAEEQGRESWFDWLVGSHANIAENHPDWAGRVVSELNIDCISFTPDDCTVECTPELFPFLGEVHAARGGKGCVFTQTSPSATLTYVDAAAYIMRGVPSANIMFWRDEYWRYYHTHYDDIALVTESSLHYAMELWGSAALRAALGTTLPLDVEWALRSLVTALVQNRRMMAEAGLDTSTTVKAIGEAAAAAAEAGALQILARAVAARGPVAHHALARVRRAQLDVLRRINADLHIIGGSFAFQMFYLPDPYARDASAIQRAIRALDHGEAEQARCELEQVYAMRAAGRYLSREPYNLYLKHLWAGPDLWATRVQDYVDVWDTWAALRRGVTDGAATSLTTLRDKALTAYNTTVDELRRTIEGVHQELSAAARLLEVQMAG
jgi:hypothetical protein